MFFKLYTVTRDNYIIPVVSCLLIPVCSTSEKFLFRMQIKQERGHFLLCEMSVFLHTTILVSDRG